MSDNKPKMQPPPFDQRTAKEIADGQEQREKEAEALRKSLEKPPMMEAKVMSWQFDEATSKLSHWLQNGWYLHSWQLDTNANGNKTFNGVLMKAVPTG